MGKELTIPKEATCASGVCGETPTEYCPFCVEEYDTPPRKVPTTFYCSEHYQKIVETGNCCYGAEQIYAHYRNSPHYEW